jgi:hypothetical protein
MKSVFRNSFFLTMIIMVTLTGCKKDDVIDENKDDAIDGKGTGILHINGREYSITESDMYIGLKSDMLGFAGYGRYITFYNEEREPIVILAMTDYSELTSKTYTWSVENWLVIGFLFQHYPDIGIFAYDMDFRIVSFVVNKNRETYDIIITGKTEEKGLDYRVTYKGSIITVPYKDYLSK